MKDICQIGSGTSLQIEMSVRSTKENSAATNVQTCQDHTDANVTKDFTFQETREHV